MKNIRVFYLNFFFLLLFLEVKYSIYLNRRVFVMKLLVACVSTIPTISYFLTSDRNLLSSSLLWPFEIMPSMFHDATAIDRFFVVFCVDPGNRAILVYGLV